MQGATCHVTRSCGGDAQTLGGLTRGRTRRDAGCRARRPSRLDLPEVHGVTPLATRSRRRHVSRGKRRAAQPVAHLNASRGLTSRTVGPTKIPAASRFHHPTRMRQRSLHSKGVPRLNARRRSRDRCGRLALVPPRVSSRQVARRLVSAHRKSFLGKARPAGQRLRVHLICGCRGAWQV